MTFLVDGSLGGTFPSWTTATRPASPAVGQMGYNTTIGQFDSYTSGGWVSVATTTSTSNKITTSQMPTGTILQVVNALYATGVSTTSGTLSDTGLTATITPTSATSKILVLVNQNGGVKTSGTGNNSIQLYLFRNSTGISAISERAGLTTNSIDMYLETLSVSYLDSPATTSAVTYKTQYATFAPGNIIYLQLVGCNSTITLMEIAA